VGAGFAPAREAQPKSRRNVPAVSKQVKLQSSRYNRFKGSPALAWP
jgi:hypothetical protein